LHREYLTKDVLEGLRDFNVGGKVIRYVKYAYYFVLLVKEGTLLEGMIDRLIY